MDEAVEEFYYLVSKDRKRRSQEVNLFDCMACYPIRMPIGLRSPHSSTQTVGPH